ncbi:RNA polymerase sigma-70 factor, ECF subfamily [Ruegeria intermedia]|uniref:RNA polymerase sigma-70 factor, ECF subfamily n=1 Tax=Ruegeria intermedia TaxID=996115 RepID=A0A1M5BR13_9RHOB|nr:sigma factor-like helix-turn-helix DNA-binding protein [Ruegeria intermedia]SHF44949.1 RNA polymerase sigma-70 factor, ECF subfamily [Ruegeria intermedia]
MSFKWHEIHDSLMNSSATLQFQKAFEALRRGDPVLGRFTDPAALLDVLHEPTGCAERKNRILIALVATAQSDGLASDCAVTLALLALWPGLDAVRRRLLWCKAGRPDEVSSEVLARATETLRGLDLDQVNRIAATVLRNVERDALRAHCREAARALVAANAEPDELPAGSPGAEAIFLRRDVGRLVGLDADLVLRVAVDGFTQREVAGTLGLSEAAARKRYQRAMGRLREAFHEFV